MAIIIATMTLHNFIWKASAKDIEFDQLLSNPDKLPPEHSDVVALEINKGTTSTSTDSEMDAIQDNICAQLLDDRWHGARL